MRIENVISKANILLLLTTDQGFRSNTADYLLSKPDSELNPIKKDDFDVAGPNLFEYVEVDEVYLLTK